MDRNLHVYIASAGSGKTFRLSVNYVKLVVHNPFCYKTILAVTFTNAATAEMKNRIISDLYQLSKFPSSKKSGQLLNVIVPEMNSEAIFKREDGKKWTNELVSKGANDALQNILHDYSLFRIETIDSFFQSILQNFLQELGLGNGRSIELDDKAQVDIAVQNLYYKCKEPGNQKLKDGLLKYSIEKNEEGERWNIDYELAKMGEEVLKEDFSSISSHLNSETLYSAIAEYESKVRKIKSDIEKELKEFGEREMAKIGDVEVFAKNYTNGKDPANYLNRFATLDKKMFEVGANVSKVLSGEKELKPKNGVPMFDIVTPLSEAVALVERVKTDYYTSKLILEEIRNMMFVFDIYLSIKSTCETQGKFLLKETPVVLRKLINNNVAPFIYEKIGGQLTHLMIDEFQDTSATQWRNFIPLLLESQANNGQLLIVGDPKQSIYRWRNGDWTIIKGIGKRDGLRAQFPPMTDNFRSKKNIVEFNNDLFKAIADNIDSIETLNKSENEEYKSLYNEIKEIYQNASQKWHDDGDNGYVEVKQFDTDFTETALHNLAEDIIRCQIKGIEMNDMAILVRRNNDMPMIAEYFEEYKSSESFLKQKEQYPHIDLKVFSSEAYTLGASLAVRFIIDALRYITSSIEEDSTTKTILAVDYQTLVSNLNANEVLEKSDFVNDPCFLAICERLKSYKLLPLYEMVENIYCMLELDKIPNQDAYLYLFLDKVQEFMGNYGSDVVAFIDKWDSKLCNEKIPFSKGDGVCLQTIHKAKGLEYGTVFIPFANWNIAPNVYQSPLLWCKEEDIALSPEHDAEFKSLSPLPIRWKGDLSKSLFAEAYYKEALMMWIDNINLLYVATTRAVNNLFIYVAKESANSTSPLGTISRYISSALAFNEGMFVKGADIYVETSKGKKSEESENRLNIKSAPIVDFKYKSYVQRHDQFRQSRDADIFLREGTTDSDEMKKRASLAPVDYGKLVHLIFSKIATADDVDRVVEEVVMSGLDINKEELKENIHAKINNKEFKEWFAPGLRLMNERSIGYYDEDGKFVTKRPDRVILNDDETILIDFKSGKETKKYEEQLKTYASLLKDMGYKNVSAYIWYLNEDKKVEVAG